MRDLLPYLKLYKKHWFGLSLGMLLAFLTLAASIGLLTLSGWFISAAAVAGLTVARETFNYMLPGAGYAALQWLEPQVDGENVSLATMQRSSCLPIYVSSSLRNLHH